MLRSVLTLPDRMITRRATVPGFKLETALIVVFGLLGAVGVGYVGTEALNAYEGSGESLQFEFIGAALRPFVLLVLFWLLYTAAGHLLSGFYGGRGPASRLLRSAAWSLLPVGIWFALRSLVVFVLFFDVTYPGQPDGLGASEQFQSIMDLGLDTPLYIAFILTGVLFAVWSGYLLSVAVEEIKDIPMDDARKVAAVPSAVVALYFVWLALGRAGIL